MQPSLPLVTCNINSLHSAGPVCACKCLSHLACALSTSIVTQHNPRPQVAPPECQQKRRPPHTLPPCRLTSLGQELFSAAAVGSRLPISSSVDPPGPFIYLTPAMRNPMGSAGVRLLVCAVSNGLPRYSRLPDPGPAGRRALVDLDPVTVFGGGERRGAAATARQGLRLPCHTLCLAHSLQEEGQHQHGGPGPMPAGAGAGAAAVTAISGIREVVGGVGVDVVGAAVGTTALSIVPSHSTSSEPDVAGSPPAAVAATAPAPAGATASATPVLATPSTTATAATATPPVLVGPVLEGSCRGPGQEEDCCDSQGVRDTPPGTVATQETSFPIVEHVARTLEQRLRGAVLHDREC